MTLDCTCNRLTEAERKAALWDGIVRCRACKWRTFRAKYCAYVCAHTDKLAPISGYCHRGERREDA